ncbi:hypothetical protein EJ110_NYTH26977 [Nymphaea thermarum]|nr:hypothetical protein EJ110_NYTH26977 [Nymphaea thermarum]
MKCLGSNVEDSRYECGDHVAEVYGSLRMRDATEVSEAWPRPAAVDESFQKSRWSPFHTALVLWRWIRDGSQGCH